MTAFIPKYEALAVHRLMLRDEVRIETFQRAIKDNVSAGDVVIDYGAGTGILSVFAVQAGASRVYAIERTGIIDIARQVAEANQVEDRIIFIPEPAETAELPEKADVLVSEWLGAFAVQENMLPGLLTLRDRWLKPDGLMLPNHIDLFLTAIDSDSFEETWRGLDDYDHGVDLSPVSDASVHEIYTSEISAEEQVSDAKRMGSLDLAGISDPKINFGVALHIKRKAMVNGLSGWFVARFPGGVELKTGPDAATTHWQQCVFPICPGIVVERGDRLGVDLTGTPDGDVVRFCWEVGVEGTDLKQTHDTGRADFAPRAGNHGGR